MRDYTAQGNLAQTSPWVLVPFQCVKYVSTRRGTRADFLEYFLVPFVISIENIP